MGILCYSYASIIVPATDINGNMTEEAGIYVPVI